MHTIQDFKIVCNIIRANGIPIRISSPDDNDDSRGRTSPESANVFLMQSKFETFLSKGLLGYVRFFADLKYSNVRPFIAVSYKDQFRRTMTAEGSNPTWNEQLILQVR